MMQFIVCSQDVAVQLTAVYRGIIIISGSNGSSSSSIIIITTIIIFLNDQLNT